MRKAGFRLMAVALGLSMAMALGPSVENAAAQQQPPTTQVPQPSGNDVNWPGAGYGAGALLCNVVYIPAKLVYAVLGGVVGGGTYLVTAGNMQAANTVWRSSLGGDYVVTPQMLQGTQPVNFSGPTDTPPNVPSPPNSPTLGTPPVTHSTASSGTVAPITPLPPSGTGPSASSGTTGSTTSTTASSSGSGQPLDHGSGPASGSSGPPMNIE